MQISVQLTDDAAAAVRGAGGGASHEVLRTAGELGIQLHPVDAEGRDPLLSSFFHVPVADVEAAERVVARLRAAPGVQSAYLKPPDALP